MVEPALLSNEARRLAALRGLAVLDTPPEERFDRITRTLALVLDVPIALVSLLDEDRQWFKSFVGLEADEMDRSLSFANFAILEPELVVVPDARADPRFADHPLVTGPPHIRFYAGQPLHDAGGHTLGMLCAIDTVPRELSDAQRQGVVDVARWAMSELMSSEIVRGHRRFEAMLRGTSDAVVGTDAAGRINVVGDGAERMFGWRAEDTIGRPVTELLRGHGAAPGQVEVTLADANDRPVSVQLRTTALLDEVGSVSGWLTFVEDISMRHAAEEAVQRTEQRLDVLFAYVHDIVLLLDASGRIRFGSPNMSTFVGWDASDWIGMPVTDLVHPDDRATAGQAFTNLIRGEKEATGVQLRVLRADGSELEVETYGRLLSDRDNLGAGAVLTIRDVTGQREAERRARQIVTWATLGMVAVGSDSLISWANLAAGRMLGHDPDDLVGRSFHDVAHHSRADGTPYPATECALHRAYTVAREQAPAADVLWRADGSSFAAELATYPLPASGDEVAAVITFSDISARQEAQRLKDEFLSVVSHELRTPLTSLRGSLGLLAAGVVGSVDDEGMDMLEMALTSTDRLVRLVNDILDLERIGDGHTDLDRHVQSVRHVVDLAVDATTGFAREHAVDVVVGGDETEADVDTDRVVQAVTNLVSNAVKFSHAGGTVEVLVGVAGAMASITVRDSGRGIPSDKLATIFERFGQVDASDARRLGGTGLGLPITRAIARQHGGDVTVSSEIGVGSTFVLQLPLVAGEGSDGLDVTSTG